MIILPIAIQIVIVVLILFCVVFLIKRWHKTGRLNQVYKISLILALAVLSGYTYYNYFMAKNIYTSKASFFLKPYENDPYHFYFIIHNHSKISLNTWCNLNPQIYGRDIKLDNFYGGKTSVNVKPYDVVSGQFHIKNILEKAESSIEEMQAKYRDEDVKRQLHFNIAFCYNPVWINKQVANPVKPYFFDFRRNKLVMDY